VFGKRDKFSNSALIQGEFKKSNNTSLIMMDSGHAGAFYDEVLTNDLAIEISKVTGPNYQRILNNLSISTDSH
jgi:hypothetical protein